MDELDLPPPGDAALFAAWVRPHLALMANLAARLAPGLDRDDIVQESLVRAWRRRTTFDPSRGNARGWLCAIVADRARRAQRGRRPTAETLPSPLHDSDLFVDLERALAALAPRQRECVDLVYVVGLTVAEAATVLGIAPGTVKSTLSDARATLRPLLQVTG